MSSFHTEQTSYWDWNYLDSSPNPTADQHPHKAFIANPGLSLDAVYLALKWYIEI